MLPRAEINRVKCCQIFIIEQIALQKEGDNLLASQTIEAQAMYYHLLVCNHSSFFLASTREVVYVSLHYTYSCFLAGFGPLLPYNTSSLALPTRKQVSFLNLEVGSGREVISSANYSICVRTRSANNARYKSLHVGGPIQIQICTRTMASYNTKMNAQMFACSKSMFIIGSVEKLPEFVCLMWETNLQQFIFRQCVASALEGRSA